MDLAQKINSHSAVCGVIGLGYVGLPLLTRLARVGYTAVGIDVNAQRVAQLRTGRSYVGDVADEEISAPLAAGKLRVTTDLAAVAELDTINICVPTPLGKSRQPDLSYVSAVLEAVAQHLHHDQLVVLESTTYPGTTEEVAAPALERSGLKGGEDFFLAFSPERIDPGNRSYPLERIPKVVGGLTPRCTELAASFYRQFLPQVVPVSSARTAEMVKLLENTFRIVNIGLINELALLSDRLQVDIWEVVDAAATKPFGFMPFYPGPGLGGHCIPVDPFYLSWKVRENGQEARFIELAGDINRRMPLHVRERVTEALNDQHKSLNGARVLILGVTYKKDVADTRESAALDLMLLLQERGAEVVFHDPFVATLRFDGGEQHGIELSAEELRRADCVVIVADHSAYDYTWIVTEAQAVVDTRNATRGVAAPAGRVWKL